VLLQYSTERHVYLASISHIPCPMSKAAAIIPKPNSSPHHDSHDPNIITIINLCPKPQMHNHKTLCHAYTNK
jgi:hypothetical protein